MLSLPVHTAPHAAPRFSYENFTTLRSPMPQTATEHIAASSSPQIMQLRDEAQQLRLRFEQHGYVVLKNIVPRDRLTDLTAQIQLAYEQARKSGDLFSGGGNFSGHLNCFPGPESRFVYESLKSTGVLAFIKEIFPKAVGTPNVGCNFNMPNSVAQHYHVDR